MKNRGTTLGGLTFAGVLALGACAPGGGTPSTGASGEGDTLVIAVPEDIQTLDPMYANFARSHNALQQIYDTPVNLETQEVDGALVATPDRLAPSAFESWERSQDGLTYTVRLREGMTFFDGSEVTAEDVVYSFDRALNTTGGANWLLTQIAFITTPPTIVDELTIELHADAPSALAMQALYMDGVPVLDRSSIEEHATADDPWAEEWLSSNPANGSGPYQITDWQPDQQVTFTAFEDYWAGEAAITTIIWRVVPSSAQRLALLQSGDVDIAEGLTPDQLASLEGVEGVNVLSAPSQNTVIVGMNNVSGPFQDAVLRRAASYAVDYDTILEQVFSGEASRLWGPIPEGAASSLGDQIGYSQDVDQAEALVAESSYDGSTISLAYDNANDLYQQIAVLVQSGLADVGVNVELEPLTSAVFSERKAQRNLDMYVDSSLAWINDPNYILSLTFQCDVYGNYTGYCDETVDQAIADGWAMEADDPERIEMFEEAQRQLVEDAPWLFIAQPNYRLAMSSRVEGFVARQNEVPFYYDLSLAEG